MHIKDEDSIAIYDEMPELQPHTTTDVRECPLCLRTVVDGNFEDICDKCVVTSIKFGV